MILIFNFALGLIIVFALVLNTMMLCVLRSKAKRKFRGTVKNFVLSNIAFADIIQVTIGYGLQLIDSIANHDHTYCRVSGFVITFCGLASISFMTILSFDICLHICKPLKSIIYEYRMPYVFVAGGWLYGLFWSIMPCFGLGGYVVEAHWSCSLKWTQDTQKGKLFLFCLFFFCYALPVTIIVTSFTCIHFYMKRRAHQNPASGGCTRNSIKLFKTVRASNLRLCFFISITFILSWTPYSIAAGYVFASGSNSIPHALLLVSAFNAKCASLYNSIVYFYIDIAARKFLYQALCKCIIVKDRRKRNDTVMNSSLQKENKSQTTRANSSVDTLVLTLTARSKFRNEYITSIAEEAV